MTWIPLNVHSQYSILDSTASVTLLAEKAKALQIPALALTDQGNLYGAVDFFKACKAAQIQAILGCEIWIAPGSRLEKKRIIGAPSGFPLLLLAKDREGYRNLCKLTSIGFLEGFYYQPRIDKETLEKYSQGLICLSGPLEGPLGHRILHGTEESLLSEVRWYQSLFREDLYLEIQRHPFEEGEWSGESWLLQKARDFSFNQEKINRKLIELAQREGIPLVATNDIHCLEKSDWQAHEILLNLQSGHPL